ncbi:MAG: methylmalonyl-CoA mutase, partial [Candidatus Zixiibacteriota bacterium]
FFAAHGDLLEEVAKFRAARRIWARVMKERFDAKDKRSLLLRFHTQTGGSTLTAQQPENNIVRTTIEALAAVFGGTQSLHTNAYDEALALPTEKSARVALRTQQIIAYESGVTNSVDPLAGSYVVEYLTDELEKRVVALLDEIDRRGGAVAGVESGYFKEAIARSAYEYQKAVEAGEQTVVGVNKFAEEDADVPEILKLDPALESKQIDALNRLRKERNQAAVDEALRRLRSAAEAGENIVPEVLNAVEAYATVGEISDAFREIWGEYRETN